MDKIEPALYILMRSDLDSLNPGKAMAQACHAGSAFAKLMNDWLINSDVSPDEINTQNLYQQWLNSTEQGFGTVVVLNGESMTNIEKEIKLANEAGLPGELIFDPSYPIFDGSIVHVIPLHTCGYIFGDRNSDYLKDISQRYKRHP
jgi:peptidyl-tRNA hydrolase